MGLLYLDTLKNAKDKRGRQFAQLFMYLPDPRILPDYYEVIQMPVSLETIEV
jgi:hypothetical protein